MATNNSIAHENGFPPFQHHDHTAFGSVPMTNPRNWYERTSFILEKEARQALTRGDQALFERLQARINALRDDTRHLWGQQ